MMLEFKTVDWTRSNYQSNPYVDNPALSALASHVNLVNYGISRAEFVRKLLLIILSISIHGASIEYVLD